MRTSTATKSQTLLHHLSREAKGENLLAVILGLVQVSMVILFAYQVSQILNQVVYESSSERADAITWFWLALALLIRTLAANWQNRLGNRASIKIRRHLRKEVLTHCFRLNVALFPQFNVAELSNLLTTEINSLREYFADFVPQKQLSVLMPITVIIASAQINWLVPLILALTAPLIPLFMILAGREAAVASRQNLEQLNRLGNLLADRLKNLQAIKLAGSTEIEADCLEKQSDTYRHSTMKVLRMAFLSGTLLEFFSAISVALVAVYLGLYFLDKYEVGHWGGDLDLGDGVFLLMLAPEFYLPLRRMGSLYHAKIDAISVAEHVVRLQDLSLDLTEMPHSNGPEPLKNLTLNHFQAGTENALHQSLSISLKPGDRLLLNGPSGSGKTTLLDSLAGLRPLYSGQMLLNGFPLLPHQNKQWWSTLGYMAQKPELFYASVRTNLCLGQNFDDTQLFAALREARAETLIQTLPGGLDYEISDSGGYLSGGQAQRIALARIFLHQPSLLLLDEPTANLDPETATEFMHQLEAYCQSGGILIMASHRPTDRSFFNHELTLNPQGRGQ